MCAFGTGTLIEKSWSSRQAAKVGFGAGFGYDAPHNGANKGSLQKTYGESWRR